MARVHELVERLKTFEEMLAVIESLRVAIAALEAIREACPDTDLIEVRIGRYDQARELAEQALMDIAQILPDEDDAL